MGLLSLRVEGDVIVGDAVTTPVGPGFHKAVVDLLDQLIHTAGLALQVEDETGYWRDRNFDRLQQEQMAWLQALIRQVSSWEQTTLRITWPADGWAPADLTGIIHSLMLARRQDPSLPLPLAAWSEVVDLVGGDPAEAVKGPEMRTDGPVGYRRGDVVEPFPGGWGVRLPGSFLQEPEEDGGSVYWDTARNFRLTGYRFQAVTGYEADEGCWVLQGLVWGPGGMAVVTLTWSDSRWEDWAAETFRTIQPPPLTPD